MDVSAIIGILGLVLVFLFGIVYDPAQGIVFSPLQYFIHVPSLVIVLVGTIAATIYCYPLDRFLALGKIIGRVHKKMPNNLINTLVIIIDVAKIARKNVLAMEDALPSIENEFLRNALRLVVDRVDRELIVDMMQGEMKYLDLRKTQDAGVVKTMATLSPAMGMIGTLIGLVILLQNLDDPSKIGPAMAVALITTLYGALFSNAIFMPWNVKLTLLKEEEQVMFEMIRDGVLFIEKNERPEFIEQDLINYLSLELKAKYEELKFSNDK